MGPFLVPSLGSFHGLFFSGFCKNVLNFILMRNKKFSKVYTQSFFASLHRAISYTLYDNFHRNKKYKVKVTSSADTAHHPPQTEDHQ